VGSGAAPGGRGEPVPAGPATLRMPAQPQTTPPDRTQPARTRQAADRRTGERTAVGSRDTRGRRNSRRSPGRWGALQGGLGVCIIVAGAAVGTIATVLTRSAPGFLLGLCVEAGTVVAALAVRPRAGRMIFPVPVLAYLVGALVSGFVYNRAAGTSGTALAIGAAQWVADGFFAMALATVLAIVIITVRWCLWRRRRPVTRDQDWAAPAVTRSVPPRRPPTAPEAPRAQRGPRGRGSWNDPDPRGGPRRPAPRSGTGPYNFSSGA